MPIIPVPRRLRKEDANFEVSLGYVVRLCLKKKIFFFFVKRINLKLNVLTTKKLGVGTRKKLLEVMGMFHLDSDYGFLCICIC
jgi:hypothetical protein